MLKMNFEHFNLCFELPLIIALILVFRHSIVSLALCQALTPPCQVRGSLCTLLPFQACCIVQAESSTTHITTSFPDYGQSPHLPMPYKCCVKPRPCRHVKSLRLTRQMNQIPCTPVPQLSVYILTCHND
jgi:hypothetical protein